MTYHLLADDEDVVWQDYAACASTDPEAFFTDSVDARGPTLRAAKRVCARCPVRRVCLETALTNEEEYGVWGGLTATERRKITGRKITGHVAVTERELGIRKTRTVADDEGCA